MDSRWPAWDEADPRSRSSGRATNRNPSSQFAESVSNPVISQDNDRSHTNNSQDCTKPQRNDVENSGGSRSTNKGKGKARDIHNTAQNDDQGEDDPQEVHHRPKLHTRSMPTRPKPAFAAASETKTIPQRQPHKTRCILIITQVADLKEGQKGYVEGKRIGQMTDKEKSYFFTADFYVDYREGEIPEQARHPGTSKNPMEKSPEGNMQIWPAQMVFELNLKYGKQRLGENNVAVDLVSTWYFSIPAKNIYNPVASDVEQQDQGFSSRKVAEFKDDASHPSGSTMPTKQQWDGMKDKLETRITCPPIPILAKGEPSLPERVFWDVVDKSQDQLEKTFLEDQLRRGNLHYFDLEVTGGQFQESNVFMQECESKFQAHIPEYVEKIHAREFKGTKFAFKVIFYAPAGVVGLPSSSLQYEDLQNFRSAQKLENHDPTIFLRMYGQSEGTALQSFKTSKKALRYLPKQRVSIPLVYPNIEQMFMLHCLDLQTMHYLQSQDDALIEKHPFQCRTLLFDDGKTRSYGISIRSNKRLPANTNLQVGASGHITFLGSDIPKWVVRLSNLPGVTMGEDMFAIAWPPKVEVDGVVEYDKRLPKHIINIQEARTRRTLQQDMKDAPFDLINLSISSAHTTENQQFTALQKANSHTEGEHQNPYIARVVAPILAGHGHRHLTRKSIFSSRFAENIDSHVKELNEKFAKGINVKGATLSKEQLEFAIHYPSGAPSDGLLIAVGFAGTRKTTSIGAFAVAQHMDVKLDNSHKAGIVVAEMHLTANDTVESLSNIVFEGTEGKCAVREYGTSNDVRSILYLLDGCSREYGSRWSVGLDPLQFADLQDMLGLAATDLQGNGNGREKIVGIQHSATWKLLAQNNLIEGVQEKHPARYTGAIPNDETAIKLRTLVSLCRQALHENTIKETLKTLEKMLDEIKSVWYKKHATVIVTTISKLGEKTIQAFNAAWAVCEEAQYVSDHNITIFLAAFWNIPKYVIGDPEQLGPYCTDSDRNPFAEVRKHSLLAKEEMRGRPHVRMTESGRVGPTAITLPRDLCYSDEMTSGVLDHPHTRTIIKFHREVFGSRSKVPHILINAKIGHSYQIGPRQSTVNPALMGISKAYIRAYKNFDRRFKVGDVGVITPWAMQHSAWQEAPYIGSKEDMVSANTIQGIMGQEKIISILEIAKTDSVGFLNMPGMWTTALTRSSAATVIIVNHSAIRKVYDSDRRKHRNLAYYMNLVAWYKKNLAFVDWPEKLSVDVDDR